jgi:cytochrome c oxidase subunit I
MSTTVQSLPQRPRTFATVVHDPDGFELPAGQKRLIRWTVYVGYAALFAGVAHGLAQALSYGGINILQYFPGLRSYYQGLTVHGVMNALVLTFAFSNGFLPLMTARALGRPLVGWLTHATLYVMVAGVLLAGWAMATNQASVLYTSYAPLQAHPAYYLGLALVVVSTWLASANMFVLLGRWRRAHPGRRIPLLAFISVVSYAMWDIASAGIAVSFLGFMVPWSLGWIGGIDPLYTRSLFWFTGHAVVYAWLLPVYVSWYALIPRQAGGRLISDPLTRLVFIMFLLVSVPTGFHHQYTDPGISMGMKAVHGFLTFVIFFPSLATAFSIMASLEIGGRARGGRGLLGWIPKLPWGDASFTAQVLAMFTFVFGGVTGLINASYAMNQVIHNTTWVPGHFHMTVGSAVALTLMGVAYWMVPYLTGRQLWGRRVALAQAWIYTVGVLIFARGMIAAGLDGAPRRTFMAAATYGRESWNSAGMMTAVGGSIMTLGALLFFVVLGMTLLAGRKGAAPRDIPFAETLTPPSERGWDARFDRIGLWVVAAVLLIVLSYGPYFLTTAPRLLSPGFRLF